MLKLKSFLTTLLLCFLVLKTAVAQQKGCVLDQADLEKTVRVCSDVIKSGNKDLVAAAYSVRCAAYTLQGKAQVGLEDCNIAIAGDSKLSDAYRNRGSTYGLLGNFDKAYSDLSKAIELNPQDTKALGNRASLLLNLGKFQEAIKDADSLILIDPKNQNAYVMKSLAYSNQAKFRRCHGN